MKTIKKHMTFLILLLSFSYFAEAQICLSTFQGPQKDLDLAEMSKNSMNEALRERVTMEALKQAAEKKDQDSVVEWMKGIQEIQTQQPLNPLEHSTLLYIYTSGSFNNRPEVLNSIENSLMQSYRYLTNKDLPREKILTPLPDRVFGTLDSNAKLFQDVIFHQIDKDKSFTGRLVNRVKRIVGKANMVNVGTTLMTAIAMTTQPGREMIAGAFIGLAQASINEHLIHIGIGHAPKSATQFFKKSGKPGEFMEEITLAHQLHHFITSDNFGAVVLNPEQIQRAEKMMDTLVKKLMLERLKGKNENLTDEQIRELPEYSKEVERIKYELRKGGYGINGTLAGAAAMNVTALPYHFMNLAVFAATGSWTYLATSTTVMTFMILQSLYSHRYLHIRPTERDQVKTSAFQNAYMDSFLGQLQLRLHFTHHEMPWTYKGTRNGAIMAGSVSDRLKGTLQEPRVKDLIKMYYQGFLPSLQKTVNGERP